MPVDPKQNWNLANTIKHDRMQQMSDIDDATMLLRQQNPRGIIHYAELTTNQSRAPLVSANLFNEVVSFPDKNRQYNACLFVPFVGVASGTVGLASFDLSINAVQQLDVYYAPTSANNNTTYLDSSSISFAFPFIVSSGSHTITVICHEALGFNITLFATASEPIKFWIEDVGSTILGGTGTL